MIDIITISIVFLVVVYSLRKTYITNKRKAQNLCYRCGVSLDNIDVGYIRDGNSAFTIKDHKACRSCCKKTGNNVIKLFFYMFLVTIFAVIASLALGL